MTSAASPGASRMLDPTPPLPGLAEAGRADTGLADTGLADAGRGSTPETGRLSPSPRGGAGRSDAQPPTHADSGRERGTEPCVSFASAATRATAPSAAHPRRAGSRPSAVMDTWTGCRDTGRAPCPARSQDSAVCPPASVAAADAGRRPLASA